MGAKNTVYISTDDSLANTYPRFVTGLVDSKLYGRKQTMYQKAMTLGLPASFVELRHEATHRELPSLIVLRSAVQRSLDWLWDAYWAKLPNGPPFFRLQAGGLVVDQDSSSLVDNDENQNVQDLRNRTRTCLQAVLSRSGEAGRASSTTKRNLKNDTYAPITQELASMFDLSSQGILVEELLQSGMMIPRTYVYTNSSTTTTFVCDFLANFHQESKEARWISNSRPGAMF